MTTTTGSEPRRAGKATPRDRDWHELSTPAAILRLAKIRNELRTLNLHDTYVLGGEAPRRAVPRHELPPYRSYDGSGYDPADVDMGRAGTRFDRNLALAEIHADRPQLTPSPREVSRALLARHRFQPATTLNLLAAAWIQFQNHDWFFHGDNPPESPIEIPLATDDEWPDRPMCVRRTLPDEVAQTTAAGPRTFTNTVTHWWDGSQIYGSSEERCRALRTGEDGKMAMIDGRLPEDPSLPGVDLTGFPDNYWIGPSMLHTLFCAEHNAICDRLRKRYRSWSDERLFHTARLVNVALMAKIHTVEWTPAILAHPAVRRAMRVNWSGVLGEAFRRRFGRLGSNEVVSGIRGSPMEHHAAAYSITEEFVTSYRLHPLIPDEYAIRSHRDHTLIARSDFAPLQGLRTRAAVDEYGLDNLFYTFGLACPGAITLHNHPDGLRDLMRVSGEHIDLGTVDILRDRERGVPRYNGFRAMLHKPPVESFDDLSDNPRWVAEIREVYEGDIDAVDALVGMYAEPTPRGFGFSDTAFRVFVLMASRRLKSDRFFTDDYRPEIYTAEGLEWIDRNGMLSVLCRHYPQLAPALDGVDNAFAHWRPSR